MKLFRQRFYQADQIFIEHQLIEIEWEGLVYLDNYCIYKYSVTHYICSRAFEKSSFNSRHSTCKQYKYISLFPQDEDFVHLKKINENLYTC